jgi:DNA-binding beta-propeller fold protein YncE
MGRRHRRSFLYSLVVASVVPGLVVIGASPSATAAAGEHPEPGHVYVLNNDLAGPNSITALRRRADGSLALSGTTAIGGRGSLAAFADATQGSLILARDRSLLFAVDAGSDEVSVVRAHGSTLSLEGVFASGGPGPISLSYSDRRLYVLNAANTSASPANVTGFEVGDDGALRPIAGATRPLSSAHPNPAQVQVDPSGRFLLVTEKDTNLIDVYRIHGDGSLSGPSSFPSAGAHPFGMAFNPAPGGGQFVVAEAFGAPDGTGSASAYRLTGGTVQLIGGPVPDHQVAPCWLVITRDGRFAYTSNANSRSISGYVIDPSGAIRLRDADGVTALTPSDTFPLEEALSRDSRYLYVLDSRLLLPTPGPVTVGGFRIRPGGGLTSVVDEAAIALSFSAVGLAAE